MVFIVRGRNWAHLMPLVRRIEAELKGQPGAPMADDATVAFATELRADVGGAS